MCERVYRSALRGSRETEKENRMEQETDTQDKCIFENMAAHREQSMLGRLWSASSAAADEKRRPIRRPGEQGRGGVMDPEEVNLHSDTFSLTTTSVELSN